MFPLRRKDAPGNLLADDLASPPRRHTHTPRTPLEWGRCQAHSCPKPLGTAGRKLAGRPEAQLQRHQLGLGTQRVLKTRLAGWKALPEQASRNPPILAAALYLENFSRKPARAPHIPDWGSQNLLRPEGARGREAGGQHPGGASSPDQATAPSASGPVLGHVAHLPSTLAGTLPPQKGWLAWQVTMSARWSGSPVCPSVGRGWPPASQE